MTVVPLFLTAVTKAAPLQSLLLLSIIALKVHPFLPQGEERKFGRVESRTSWRETKEKQVTLDTTCSKNEQQGAKNNAEL